MVKKHRSSSRNTHVVLVFGENDNDTKAIRHLINRLRSADDRTLTVKPMKRPLSLQRDAGTLAVSSWLDQIVKVANGELHEIAAIAVHRDADRVDRDGTEHSRLRDQLRTGLKSYTSVPVVPVVELESWWFLFPNAVRAVNPGAWRALSWRPSNPDTLNDPKGELKRLTRRIGPEYHESDSVPIAEAVDKLRLDPVGNSPSWSRFVNDISTLST